MDDTQKQQQELINGIQERVLALDAPVRELLMSNEYVVNLNNIISAHSLNPENAKITEEITTSFLLGTIHPSDLEQVFIEDLSNMTKDSIRSLHNDIKSKILYKVWNIVEEAWQEDDEKEALFKEVVELSEVPLPPNLQQTGVSTVGEKIEKEINQKIFERPSIQENKESFSIEQKLAQKETTETQREKIDRTIPQISLSQGDLYREKPE